MLCLSLTRGKTTMSKNWSKVKIEANLVSLPGIYWRLKEIIATRDYSLQDIAQLIAHDPGITARLLRIVNSAFFGFSAKIDTVHHAVSILGVQQIEDLVLATSVADALGDYRCEHLDIRRFWVRSVYRAIAARNLAAECNLLDGERLFVAGLLSGIGHLIMYQSIPILAQQAQRESDRSGQPLHLVERDIIGFNHAEVAAMMMQSWQLPASQVAVIRNHLEPDAESEFFLETAITHLAALIANASVDELPLDQALGQADERAWDVTGLDTGRCEAINLSVAEQLNEALAMLLPGVRQAAV